MKLFFGVVLLVSSVLIGYVLSRKFTKRTEFYRSYKEFNSLVRREVSYSQLSIPQILKTVDYDNDFWTCLKHFYSTKEFVFETTSKNSPPLTNKPLLEAFAIPAK